MVTLELGIEVVTLELVIGSVLTGAYSTWIARRLYALASTTFMAFSIAVENSWLCDLSAASAALL